MTLLPVLLVDLDGDGVFPSASTSTLPRKLPISPTIAAHDLTAYTLASPGVSAEAGKDQAVSLSPPMAGELRAVLDNRDGRFSWRNAASVYYQKLQRGIEVRLNAVHTTGGAAVAYRVWTGYLWDVEADPDPAAKTVTLSALGIMARLARHSGYSSNLYTNITTDVALGYVLDLAGLTDTAWRSFETGRTTLRFFWVSSTDDLAAVAASILAAEGPGAALYEDAQGRLVFQNRGHRFEASASTSSTVTFTDAGAEPGYRLRYLRGERLNRAIVYHRQRSLATALTTIWTCADTPFTLGAQASRSWSFSPDNGDPFNGAVCVDGVDIIATFGTPGITLSATSGGGDRLITLTIQNTGTFSVAPAMVVSSLRVRAYEAPTIYEESIVEDGDTSDGIDAKTIDAIPETDRDVLQSFAEALVVLNASQPEILEVSLNDGHSDRITQALTRAVSDRVTVTETNTALSAVPSFIEARRYHFGAAGEMVAVLGTQAAVVNTGSGVTVSLWDSGRWDEGYWGW